MLKSISIGNSTLKMDITYIFNKSIYVPKPGFVCTIDALSGNTKYEFLTRIVASTDRIKSTRTFISLDF